MAVGRLLASVEDRPIVIDCLGERIVMQFEGVSDAWRVWRRMPRSMGRSINMAGKLHLNVELRIGRRFPFRVSSQRGFLKWLLRLRAS